MCNFLHKKDICLPLSVGHERHQYQGNIFLPLNIEPASTACMSEAAAITLLLHPGLHFQSTSVRAELGADCLFCPHTPTAIRANCALALPD